MSARPSVRRRFAVLVAIAGIGVGAGAAPAAAAPTVLPRSVLASSDRAPVPLPEATSIASASQAGTPPRVAVSDAPVPGSEVISKRTATSRTTVNADGSYTTELFADAINYQPAGTSDWQPIDLTFAPSADGKSASVTKSPTAVTVRSAADPNGVLSVALGGQAITLRPATPSVSSVAPAVTGSEADVPAVLPGVSLRVFSSAKGVNVFLVLAQAPSAPTFTFVIDAPNLTVSLDRASGRLLLKDAKNALVGSFHAPYAVDSTLDELTGGGRMTSAVSYSLGKIGGKPAVTISVDPAWLASATYPVFIDPTIYNDGTNTYGDASVNQGNPNLNYGNYKRPDSPGYYEMWLGESPSDSTYYNEAFIKFDLSSIADTTVDSASIEVRPYHQYYNAPTATNTWLRKVTGSWTESAITWNTKPGVASGYIDVTGCVEGQQCAFSVTSLVQSWVTTPSTNNGIRLDENGNGPTYWKRLIASEQQTTTRPRLIVTTHDPVATPTTPTGPRNSRTLSWTYSDSGSDPQSHYEIDVDTDSGFAAPIYYDGAATAGTSPSAAIPGTVTLTSGTTYYWRVKVKNGTSWSAWGSSSFVWDTTAPAVPSTPDLASTSDSGSSNTDNITNYTTPTLTGTETENGSTVTVLDGGTPVGTAVVSGGAWTITTSALGSGTHSLTATATDVATNTSAASGALTVTIDTTAPAVPSTPDLVAASDSGSSSTDNLTNDATPTLSGSESENGVTVALLDGQTTTVGSTVVAGQAWSITTGTLNGGPHPFTATATDIAGNVSQASAGLTVTIDTVAPPAPSQPDLLASSDTGISSTDDITSDTTPTLSGTASENGATVSIIDSVTGLAVGSATVATGAWTITTSTLATGNHTLSATAADAAGNISSASTGLLVTIASAPGTPATPDLDAASDTGSSSVDNITKDNTPTFVGTGTNGDTVTVYDGAVVAGTTTVGGGVWAATVSLGEGTHEVSVAMSNAAGTSPLSPALSVTVDLTAPAAPVAPLLAASSDTGSSDSDGITNDATPTLTGSGPAGAEITLVVDGSRSSTGPVASGAWTITTSSIADGGHGIAAIVADPAGNESAQGPATSVTIDTVAPTADFVSPDELSSATVTTSPVAVSWAEDGTGSGVGARSLSEVRGSPAPSGNCTTATLSPDAVSSSDPSPFSASLETGNCYAWTITITDLAGNSGAATSGRLLAQLGPSVDFTTPDETGSTSEIADEVSVEWTESQVASRSIQRERGPISVPGSCAGVSWSADGTATGSPSPLASAGLQSGFCYRWSITVEDALGTPATFHSGTVLVDTVLPTGAFTAPTSFVRQDSGYFVVSWTETDAESGPGSHRLIRQALVPPGDGTCVGVDWEDDASPIYSAGPVIETSLVGDMCYRWVLSVTDNVGNTAWTTSSPVLVDHEPPTADFVTPNEGSVSEADTSRVQVAWSASDATSAVTTSLQRQVAATSGSGCSTSWANDGSPSTEAAASRWVSGLLSAHCYRWNLTVQDEIGNATTYTSGTYRLGDLIATSLGLGQTTFASEAIGAETNLPSVTQIDFLVDGSVIQTDATAPYSASWDTTALADGPHSVQIRATQTGGAVTTSAATNVVVANAATTATRLSLDLQSGELSLDDYVTTGLRAAFGSTAVPARYESSTPLGPGDAQTYSSLVSGVSSSAQQDAFDLLMFPFGPGWAEPGSDLGAPVTGWAGCGDTHDTLDGHTIDYCHHDSIPGHFHIDYVLGSDPGSWTFVAEDDDGLANGVPDGSTAGNQVPDLVDRVEARLEAVYSYYVNDLGFPDPLAAGERINIVFGVTDQLIGGNETGITSALGVPFVSATADTVTIDLDPRSNEIESYDIPHELFHGFEYLDYRAPYPWDTGTEERQFWYESSANWAAHRYVQHVQLTVPGFGSDHRWSSAVDAYLATPELELSTRNSEQRQYGASSLAETLSNDQVKRSWQLIGAGQTGKQAIATAVNEQAAGSFGDWLLDFAQRVYELTPPDPAHPDATEDVWLAELLAYAGRPGHDQSTPLYTGPDSLSDPTHVGRRSRPSRHVVNLFPGQDEFGEVSVGEQGMSFIDLNPITSGAAHSAITVRVARPDDNVEGRIVPYRYIDSSDHTKGLQACGQTQPLAFTDNEATTVVELDSPCEMATLYIVREGPGFTTTVQWSATAAVGAISNGTVQLGVNPLGNLIIDGGSPSIGTSESQIGLRLLSASGYAYDGVAPGCDCEGWGVSNGTTSGFVKASSTNPTNLTLDDYAQTSSTADSLATAFGTFEVRHLFTPIAGVPNLYQVQVTVTNTSATSQRLLYRRAIDWDVEPTQFNEYVSVGYVGSPPTALAFSDDNGFQTADPKVAPDPILTSGYFTDAGPRDLGVHFDLDFGTLAPGVAKTFYLYLGAAPSESAAMSALSTVGAEAYSLGEPSSPGGRTFGQPVTFIFAFKEA